MGNISSSEERTRLRQRRIMQYFIDAADEIIREEGIQAVTIRSVSERAGYASASLYNYFDNVNHLVFLATMNHLEAYNRDAAQHTAGCANSLEVCLVVYRCFCRHSFAEPEVYELLFFTSQDQKLEDYTRQYYALFPDKADNEFALMSKMSQVNNVYSRSSIMMRQCVEDGCITPQNADDVNQVSMMVYKCFLQDVSAGRKDAQSATDEFMRYYRQLLGFYAKPECRSLVAEAKE